MKKLFCIIFTFTLVSVMMLNPSNVVFAANTIYVDIDAIGVNDGSSWTDAFTDLQDALDTAVSGDEIWVAEGSYTPSVEVGGIGSRYKTFQMKNGVNIYGGFNPSVGDDEWIERDWENNLTVLSGDLNGDDIPGNLNTNRSDNSYHVFYHTLGTDLDSTAILDGFTIKAGHANQEYTDHDNGGGMFNSYSSPIVTNCEFLDNYGLQGGGMYNYNSSPTVTYCSFLNNIANFYGGGIYNEDNSSPIVSYTVFSGNSALVGTGGGIRNYNFSSTTVDYCIFDDNFAENGGAIYNQESSVCNITDSIFTNNSASYNGAGISAEESSSLVVTSCTFSDNSALDSGGGIAVRTGSSSAIITDCSFTSNSAMKEGGAVRTDGTSSVTIANSIFTDNTATDGGGIANDGSSSLSAINCTFYGNSASNSGGGMANWGGATPLEVINCVLWENTAVVQGNQIFPTYPSSVNISYSDIEGSGGSGALWDVTLGVDGGGNIDDAPMFLNPISGDLHITSTSPCIDAADNTAVPSWLTTDFDGENRIIDDPATSDTGNGTPPIIDMGADEYRPPSLIDPVADANGPYEGIVDSPVTFDGSSSYDVDGIIVSWDWDYGNGETGSGETPTHPYAAAGLYTVTLTVTDNHGLTHTDVTTATIQSDIEVIEELIILVKSMGLTKGVENPLISKLENAIKALDKGRAELAEKHLEGFLKHVETKRGNKLTNEQADILLEEVQEIINTL